MRAYESEALAVMEDRQEKPSRIAEILQDWAEDMIRSNEDVQGYPRQSPAQTFIDMNYDVDKEGKQREALPTTGKGLPCGGGSQTRTRKGPSIEVSDHATMVETCIIHVCRYRPDLLRVLRAEYLNIVPHNGKLVRRPRDTTKTLTEYRTAMAPKLGISERRWRQLLSEAHTAIGCLLSLLESGFTDVEAVRRQMRREWVTIWAVSKPKHNT